MNTLLENYLTLKNNFRDKSFSNAIMIVSDTFQIKPNKVMASSGRKRHFVQARNMLCYIMYSKLDYRLEAISNRVGYKHHSSVIHALSMHGVDVKYNKEYREKYQIVLDGLVLDDPHDKGVDFGNSKDTLKAFHYKILAIESRMESLEKCLTN